MVRGSGPQQAQYLAENRIVQLDGSPESSSAESESESVEAVTARGSKQLIALKQQTNPLPVGELLWLS